MKITQQLLSPEEKTILADFVNSEYWPVVRKVLQNFRNNVKEVALGATTLEEMSHNRGRVYQIDQEMATYTRNFTKMTEKKTKGAKNAIRKIG